MAVGVWGASTALFSGIGPAIGGVFTQELSWRWILWLNVIVGVLILIGVAERGALDPRRADGLTDRAGDVRRRTWRAHVGAQEAPTPWASAR